MSKLAKVQSDDVKHRRLTPYQRWVKDRIPAGQDHWEYCTGKPDAAYADFVKLVIKKMMPGHRAHIGKPLGKPKGEPAYAMINHNRWVVMCECMGQETVDIRIPQFYCWSCHNFANHGKARPIIFPADKAAIEAVLIQRPDAINRNWVPLEIVEDLVGQNLRHGLPGGID